MSIKKRSRFTEFRQGLGPAIRELKFTLKRIKKSPLSLLGIAIIIFYASLAILAPVLAPPVNRDPNQVWNDGFSQTPKPPGTPVLDDIAKSKGYTQHIFGTAELQYDIYYGVIWGSRTAFRIGVLVIVTALAIGIVLGCMAGYYGGVMDELMMRFTDIVLAFPGLILAMALVIALPRTWLFDMGIIIIAFAILLAPLIFGYFLKIEGRWMLLVGLLGLLLLAILETYVFGNATIWMWSMEIGQLDKILIALAIVGWPGYTRVIRGEILRIRREDYIEAAKAIGCSDFRVVTRHIIPNAIYPVVIMASLDIGSMVLTAAALSFLGIGAPTGYADWGQMISFARNWVWSGFQDPWKYWYTFIIPGVFIFTFVLGWNLLGDAFRDILDPTLRRK